MRQKLKNHFYFICYRKKKNDTQSAAVNSELLKVLALPEATPVDELYNFNLRMLKTFFDMIKNFYTFYFKGLSFYKVYVLFNNMF